MVRFVLLNVALAVLLALTSCEFLKDAVSGISVVELQEQVQALDQDLDGKVGLSDVLMVLGFGGGGVVAAAGTRAGIKKIAAGDGKKG